MHDCPYCEEACDCDGEDHDQPAPLDCRHNCDESDDVEDFDPDGAEVEDVEDWQ